MLKLHIITAKKLQNLSETFSSRFVRKCLIAASKIMITLSIKTKEAIVSCLVLLL